MLTTNPRQRRRIKTSLPIAINFWSPETNIKLFINELCRSQFTLNDHRAGPSAGNLQFIEFNTPKSIALGRSPEILFPSSSWSIQIHLKTIRIKYPFTFNTLHLLLLGRRDIQIELTTFYPFTVIRRDTGPLKAHWSLVRCHRSHN